ncbi:hypothetical protein ACQV5M_13205 [Leptospira sp. SA-E8]|uniref:hypothetical protein n=1 Tax=Leptospira sp. SA-E8 TaxID=3422259 RepID=UPI003EBF781E
MATQLKRIPNRITKSKITNFRNFARCEIRNKFIGKYDKEENKFHSWGMALEKIQKQYYKAVRYSRIYQHIINPWREAEAQIFDYFYDLYYKFTHDWERKESSIIKEMNSLKFKTGMKEDLNEFKIVYYQTSRYFNDFLKKRIVAEKIKSEDPDGPFRRVKKQIDSEISDTKVLEGESLIAFIKIRRTFSLKSSRPWKLAEARVRDQLGKDLEKTHGIEISKIL